MEAGTLREMMETENGAVWYVEDGGYFWIRFGNIRWRMCARWTRPSISPSGFPSYKSSSTCSTLPRPSTP